MTTLRNILQRSFSTCLLLLLISPCDSRRSHRDEVPATEIDENGCQCIWTQWMNNDDYRRYIGDNTTYENLRRLYDFCQEPKKIKCRDKYRWSVPYNFLHLKNTKCDVTTGLNCVSIPWRDVRKTKGKPHYCSDYEITVQCCYCPTTTTLPLVTTVSMTTEEFQTKNATVNGSALEKVIAVDMNLMKPATNETASGNRTTSDEEIPLTLILICVFGSIVIAAFIAIIWLILTRAQKKSPPHHNYYEEAPLGNFSPATARDKETTAKPKVAFSFTKESTSDFITSSSEDEGYRSRPTYNRKRKTKSQRDRKLNGNHGYGSDSFEFPTLGSITPTDDNNSDDGRFRKWFPDEYERSMQQKSRQPVPKTRLLFATPFSSNSKRSTPSYIDGES